MFPAYVAKDKEEKTKETSKRWLQNESYKMSSEHQQVTHTELPDSSSAEDSESIDEDSSSSSSSIEDYPTDNKRALQSNDKSGAGGSLYYTDRSGDNYNLCCDRTYFKDVVAYRRLFKISKALGLKPKPKLPKRYFVVLKKKNLKCTKNYNSSDLVRSLNSCLPDFLKFETFSDAVLPATIAVRSEELLKESAQISRKLDAEPKNLEAWLQFINFQDEFLDSVFPKEPNSSLKIKRKLSILQKARECLPNSLTLLEMEMNMKREVVDEFQLLNEWKVILSKKPKDVNVWKCYLNFLNSCSTTRLSTCTKAYSDYIHIILNKIRARHDPDDYIRFTDAMFSYAVFLKQAGYCEKAVAIYQAFIDFNVFQPNKICTLDELIKAYGNFWESGRPRLGETNYSLWYERTVDHPPASDNPQGYFHLDKDLSCGVQWLHVEFCRENEQLWAYKDKDDEKLEDVDRYISFEEISLFLVLCPSEMNMRLVTKVILNCFVLIGIIPIRAQDDLLEHFPDLLETFKFANISSLLVMSDSIIRGSIDIFNFSLQLLRKLVSYSPSFSEICLLLMIYIYFVVSQISKSNPNFTRLESDFEKEVLFHLSSTKERNNVRIYCFYAHLMAKAGKMQVTNRLLKHLPSLVSQLETCPDYLWFRCRVCVCLCDCILHGSLTSLCVSPKQVSKCKDAILKMCFINLPTSNENIILMKKSLEEAFSNSVVDGPKAAISHVLVLVALLLEDCDTLNDVFEHHISSALMSSNDAIALCWISGLIRYASVALILDKLPLTAYNCIIERTICRFAHSVFLSNIYTLRRLSPDMRNDNVLNTENKILSTTWIFWLFCLRCVNDELLLVQGASKGLKIIARNRLKRVFQEAVKACPKSNLLYRLYMKFCADYYAEEVDHIFGESIKQAPFIKALYLDYLRYRPDNYKAVVNMMIQRELRVRLHLDEFDLLSQNYKQ